MADTITQSTLEWARSHDWGKDAYLAQGAIGGLYEGETGREDVTFTSRDALRAWAGY